MTRENENNANWGRHTVGLGIWRDTLKYLKYKKYTMYDLDWDKKTDNCRKWDANTVWPWIWQETM